MTDLVNDNHNRRGDDMCNPNDPTLLTATREEYDQARRLVDEFEGRVFQANLDIRFWDAAMAAFEAAWKPTDDIVSVDLVGDDTVVATTRDGRRESARMLPVTARSRGTTRSTSFGRSHSEGMGESMGECESTSQNR